MGIVWRGRIRRALEEELFWHLKDMGHLLQPARPHAVDALLVFLHLLEGEAESGSQLLLAHCKHKAAHAHPAADVLVDGIRDLLRGNGIAGRHGLAKAIEQKSSRR